MTQHRRLLTLLLACLGVAVFVFLLRWAGVFLPFERRLADRLLDTRPASPDIVIISIDDSSISEFGVWPWPRSLHARLIDKLVSLKAKTIGYDVTFSEAGTVAADDKALATAISNAGNVILASEAILKNATAKYPVAEENLVPLNAFKNNAAGYGVTTLIPDPDGFIRRVPLLLDTKDGEKKSFSVLLAESSGNFQLSTFNFPLEDGLFRVPYVNGPNSFKRYRFADVLNDKVKEGDVAGRIVLVGATAKNLHDEHLTPFGAGAYMPGVEIQANIIQALLDHRTLRPFPLLLNLALYILLALFMTLGLLWLRVRYVPAIALGLMLAYLVAALILSSRGWLMPVLYPLLAIVGMAVADLVHRYLYERNRRAWIHAAFGHYLAPQVIAKLLADPKGLKLGGTKQNLTILFSDIRGFTTLSEALGAEPLVAFLNEYLTHMTDLVLDTEGVLDKYIGDAVMAFWGAPLKQDDHAVRACKTALNMKRKLDELRPKWIAEGKPEINIGIGVNTDDVVVGNMGSKKRFDYTVIGDGVNLASRLEGLTKQYGVMILVTDNTRRLLPENFVVREIDRVAVKGKTQPIAIFELLSDNPQDTPAKKLAEKFSEALGLYRQRNWDAAKAAFQNIVATFDDKAAGIFVARCDYMKEHDPGATWDEVYVAKEK